MEAPIPTHEADRLAALNEYRILDTKPEQAYDDITAIAAQICGVPMTMISLVDEARQWFKSKLGTDREETSREIAFCAHAILQRNPFVVPDATKDRRFAGTALVTGEPHIRFYGGFPLINPEGHALGTLCAMDRKPRRLSAGQEKAMEALARQVMALLESRRVSARLADALDHIKLLKELLPICAWCKRIRDDKGYWDKVEAYFHERTGVDFTSGICPECLQKLRSKRGEEKRRLEAGHTRGGSGQPRRRAARDPAGRGGGGAGRTQS